MNPKKQVIAKANKNESGTKLENQTLNEKIELTQELKKLEFSFRKRMELDEILKQKSSKYKKETITLDKLELLLQEPDSISSLSGLLKENREANITTISMVDPVTSQHKVLQDKIREIIYTLNKLES